MEEKTEFGKTELVRKIIPYSVTALVFGIVSIVMTCCLGWVAAIVALVLYKKGMKIYSENPPDYKESSQKMLRNAKICGIIGLIVSIVTTMVYIILNILNWN